MKIRLLCDLHCERGLFDYRPVGENVVVLPGDVHSLNRHEEFLDQIPLDIPVIMVPGNHEYYDSEFHAVNEYLRELNSQRPNFICLFNESIHVKGVEFFGGTMFTDFDNNPLAELEARKGINDFSYIYLDDERSSRYWTTEAHKDEHRKFCDKLSYWLKRCTDEQKRVVISHFCPHPLAIHPTYRDSGLINDYFTADMNNYMGWPGLWLFGHSHESSDVMVGETRVVNNPHGYNSIYDNADFDPHMIIEI